MLSNVRLKGSGSCWEVEESREEPLRVDGGYTVIRVNILCEENFIFNKRKKILNNGNISTKLIINISIGSVILKVFPLKT